MAGRAVALFRSHPVDAGSKRTLRTTWQLVRAAHGHAQPHAHGHLLGTACAPPTRRSLHSDASNHHASSLPSQAAPPSSTTQPEDPLKDLNRRKREYALEVSALRRQFALEHKERRREVMRLQAVRREAAASEKASHAGEKKAAREARAQRAMEQQERLRVDKEELKALNASRRQEREKQLASRREAEVYNLHVQSTKWIGEEELERRILEAMAKPYSL